jgi:DNA-binding SARP family transcriptional activator
MDPAAAGRNFKVTLNSLYHVLEPDRDPGSESALICRDGSAYGIRPGADIRLDAERFAALVAQANTAFSRRPADAARLLEEAIDLYKGDYLPEALYETWAAAERERLAVLFLSAADRLAELYVDNRRYEQAVELAYRILKADNCWERAYRHLMLAYRGLGDHGQIARVYHRCVQTLKEELDVLPAPETTALFESLAR